MEMNIQSPRLILGKNRKCGATDFDLRHMKYEQQKKLIQASRGILLASEASIDSSSSTTSVMEGRLLGVLWRHFKASCAIWNAESIQ